MSSASPFVVVRVPCPVCGRDVTNRYIKTKSYIVQNRDVDGRIIDVRWLNPEFQHVRVQDYMLWVCPHCGYADTKGAFRDGEERDRHFDLMKDKLLEATRAGEPVIESLRSGIHYADEIITPESAVNAHLLAIYTRQLLSPNLRPHERLAQFYLRLGWYRREEWAESIRLSKDQAERMARVKGTWNDLPETEQPCLRKAVEHFNRALALPEHRGDPRHQIGTLGLVASIHQRLGERGEAMGVKRQIFEIAREARNERNRVLEEGGRAEQEFGRERLQQDVEWLTNAIEETKASLKQIFDEIVAEETPKVEQELREQRLLLNLPLIEMWRKEGRFHEATLRALQEHVELTQAAMNAPPPGAEVESAAAANPAAPEPEFKPTQSFRMRLKGLIDRIRRGE
ncbi:MAG: DUF2225 domain-containing protein [Planctomycetes bacterium]|nr:DUF2225 domain-containing protein [Planctomycetota bacterium]